LEPPREANKGGGKGFVDKVVIGHKTDVIAVHIRSYASADIIFEPLHYLPLIERKINALEQAAPLQNWELPKAFETLQRILERRSGTAGKREYVQVLRLLERFDMGIVQAAIKDALLRRAISFDAIRHLVLCRVERRPARLPSRHLLRNCLSGSGYEYISVPTAYQHPDNTSGQLRRPSVWCLVMTDSVSKPAAPELLLASHLKTLRLPTFLREHDKLARQCASEGLGHVRYLARLTELELIDRERRMIERKIKAAKFPAIKTLDSFDFKVIPSLNKLQVADLACCGWIERRENVIVLGPSGTGKTHIALGLGLAACQKGLTVRFITASALVHELMEA
jgi:hypothetical protein